MKKTFVFAIIAIFVCTSVSWAGKTIMNAPGGKRTSAQLTNTMAFPLDSGTSDYWTDLAEHYAWVKAQMDVLYASKPWYDGAAITGSVIKFYGPTVANGGHGTYTSIQGADYVGDEGTGIQWRLPITYPSTGVTGIIKTDSLGNMAVTSVTGNSKYVGTNADGTYGVFDLPTPTQASLNVDDLITLSGVAEGSVNLGAFTGTTIADNQTIKAALQALETALEGISTSGISDLDDLPGDTVDDNLIDVGLIADLGPMIHNKTSKTTPVDADIIPLSDSADSWLLKGLSWANLKATLNSLYTAAFTLTGNGGKMVVVNSGGTALETTNTLTNIKIPVAYDSVPIGNSTSDDMTDTAMAEETVLGRRTGGHLGPITIGSSAGQIATGNHTHSGYLATGGDLDSLESGITGMVKGAGNGGGYSAGAAGTDYSAPGTAETITASRTFQSTVYIGDGGDEIQTYYDATPSSDDTWSGPKILITAGEAIAQWDLLYAKNASGTLKWYKYDANGTDKLYPPRAIALAAIDSDATGVAGIGTGIARNDGWSMTTNQDEGKSVWASGTAGALTLTQPATSADELGLVGYVLEENVVQFNLGNVVLAEVP